MVRAIGRLTALKVEKAKSRAVAAAPPTTCVSRQKARATGSCASCRSPAALDGVRPARALRPRRSARAGAGCAKEAP